MARSEAAHTGREFQNISVPDGSVALWWLGQSGFAVRAGGANVLLDPFLGPNEDRQYDPPLQPEDTGWVDVVACTHEHIDHFDPRTVKAVAETSPNARIVLPTPIVSMATDLGIAPERVIGAQPGESIELDGVTLHPVRAVHGRHMTDAYTDGRAESGGLVRFLGYVVEAGGVRVYHAGDTLVYDGMVDDLTAIGVDVALLPINGRSFFREAQDLVGNMGPRDAAELAARIGADLLIPMHYDAFAGNLGYPNMLVEIVVQDHPDLQVALLSLYRTFLYTRPTTARDIATD